MCRHDHETSYDRWPVSAPRAAIFYIPGLPSLARSCSSFRWTVSSSIAIASRASAFFCARYSAFSDCSSAIVLKVARSIGAMGDQGVTLT
jgi:hypothetical protein